MEKLYFTKKGLEKILNQKTELFKKLREVQSKKGEAAEIGGNQWHDNFSFEELARQEFMLTSQIREINEKVAKIVIVDEVSKDTSRLQIGHIATLDIDGKHKILKIGGYEDTEQNANPPIIAYNAPLIRPFIGKEVEYTISLNLGGKTKTVTLEKIFLEEQL